MNLKDKLITVLYKKCSDYKVLIFYTIGISVSLNFIGCETTNLDFNKKVKPITHVLFDSLLKLHVDNVGDVDYKGFIKDSTLLNQYLALLANNPPDTTTWDRNTQMAFWINAYNAFTIKLIVDNYPVESIKDLNPTISVPFVNSIWDIAFFEIGGVKMDLNHIEHEILRDFYQDPRIHFVINCASISCPRLLNRAYKPETLEIDLEQQAKEFINDPAKNRLNEEGIEVSKIFFWFGGDFKKKGTLIDFLNRYANKKINNSAEIDYMAYNWLLNSTK